MALLAHLFRCFEGQMAPELVLKKKRSTTISNTEELASSVSSSSYNRSLHSNSDKVLSTRPGAVLTTNKLPHSGLKNSLESQSAGPLLALPKHKRTSDRVLTNTNASSDVQSESFSRVFTAPFRSSLNASQMSALAAFKKDAVNSVLQGVQTQSSPFIHAQVSSMPVIKTKNAPRSLISASADNLNLQEQMLNDSSKNRVSFARNREFPLGTTTHRTNRVSSTTDKLSGVDSTDYENFTKKSSTLLNSALDPSSSKSRLKTNDTKIYGSTGHSHITDGPKANPKADVAKVDNLHDSVPVSISSEHQHQSPVLQVRGSFTLDKQHTYASANAAGLPIINNREEPAKESPETSQTEPSLPTATTTAPRPSNQDSKHSSIASVSKMDNGMIMLTDMLQLHHDGWIYSIPAHKTKLPDVPPSVRDLKVSLMPVLQSLQTKDTYMESAAMMHRLRIQPEAAKMVDNKEVSASNNSSAQPVVTHNVVTSTASSSGTGSSALVQESTEHQPINAHQLVKTSASLEQFENDEMLVKLQASPGSSRLRNSPSEGEVEQDANKTTSQPFQELPIVSTGQAFHEQKPENSIPVPKKESTMTVPQKLLKIEYMLEDQPNPWVSPLHQHTGVRSIV